jgi:hypothetical protein
LRPVFSVKARTPSAGLAAAAMTSPNSPWVISAICSITLLATTLIGTPFARETIAGPMPKYITS